MSEEPWQDPAPDPSSSPAPSQPAGLEAPLTSTADPAKKTSYTHDPDATDPGNGAD
jgi:hypothetical protein